MHVSVGSPAITAQRHENKIRQLTDLTEIRPVHAVFIQIHYQPVDQGVRGSPSGGVQCCRLHVAYLRSSRLSADFRIQCQRLVIIAANRSALDSREQRPHQRK